VRGRDGTEVRATARDPAHDLVHVGADPGPVGAAVLRAGEVLLNAPVADSFVGGDEWPVEERAVSR
jgi:hypothetical protein